ncbi:MAG: glycogen synthase GlgA [Acidobacteriota bacterium]|jgi:starch synthase|nr:glycogen synthase GlgA [Acidobacteriota bacterium]
MPEKNALRIVMIAAEAAPYAKVGGLGDVIGALPQALEKLGAKVAVIIPSYGNAADEPVLAEPCHDVPGFDVTLGDITEYASVFQTSMPESGVAVYLIGSRRYFERGGVYDDPLTGEGYSDNMERYVFFMKAAIELMLRLPHSFDIVHCHDSQAALIPGLIRENYGGEEKLARARTIFTIHNIAYQGNYPAEALDLAGISPHNFYPFSPFEFWGQVNFMKAGIALADEITTVSPTYAEEIQETELGFGLESVLRERSANLHGIINGIDYNEWNPETDPFIAARFSSTKLSGKAVCKREVLEYFNLGHGRDLKRVPLIGIISRLANQKGFDLIAEAIPAIVEMDLLLVILGTGQQYYNDLVSGFAACYPEKIAARLAFDNPLAHKIEAGCDMFLMPSRYEPCGLSQLYSLRYGTIPIVHRKGGLADTVIPYGGNSGTGFSFTEYSADALTQSIGEALSVYSDPPAWKKLMMRAMAEDWSWETSAGRYMDLYQKKE